MERDCSLSSTQRIVLFGFMDLSRKRGKKCPAKNLRIVDEVSTRAE
jgi:hypothetical protein